MPGAAVHPLRLAGLFCLLACASIPPVIDERRYARAQPALVRVAVVPFAATGADREDGETGVGLIERFVTEEIAQRGVEVISAQEVRIALGAHGLGEGVPDTSAAVRIVAADFGVTGVLVGRVRRFDERIGHEYGAESPAAVSFQLSLYDAASGRRLWVGSFDQRQHSLSEGPREARRYPGGGMRWLTATELARWGVREAADALVAGP